MVNFDKVLSKNIAKCEILKPFKMSDYGIKDANDPEIVGFAKTFNVKSGNFFRIESVDGPQVGDLNLFNAENLDEKFYSGKTRALYGTHISVGDKMFSSFPYLRSLATITWDTLDWYGYDKDGGSVHDVIGTRCDPYTSKLISDKDYHYCCHSNLTRALVKEKNVKLDDAEKIVHDVLNAVSYTHLTLPTNREV